MALVIPVGYAQVAYRWLLGGDPEPMISTTAVTVSGEGGDYVGLGEDLNTEFSDAIGVDGMSNEWVYLGVILRVGQDGGEALVVEVPRSDQGAVDAGMLPNNCAILVRKITARGGRSGRGRMFLPPFSLIEDEVDGRGVLEPTFLEGTQTNIDAWLGGAHPKYLLHDETAPGGTVPDPITQHIVDRRIASQRRRLRR